MDRSIIENLASTIESHYLSHGVSIKLTVCEIVNKGERLVYTADLLKGSDEDKIFKKAKSIKMALKLPLFQPFHEGLSIRISVSARPVIENSLQKMLNSREFQRNRRKMRLCLTLGYSMRGSMVFYDLCTDSAPHTLKGGGSGVGKSVGTQCDIVTIAVSQPVSRVNLVIIDCGGNSLDVFHSLPHLSHPIVKDTKTAGYVLKSMVAEVNRRLTLSPEELRELPIVVIFWDEYNSTIKEITDNEERKALTDPFSDLLRRARKTKIHIVCITQESTKGDMMINLNNFNARTAYRCCDHYNSRAILGVKGAEMLPGDGALLFKSPKHLDPIHIQGAFISTKDIESVVASVNAKGHDLSNKFVIPTFEEGIDVSESELIELDKPAAVSVKVSSNNAKDKELAKVIMYVLGNSETSGDQLKAQFNMGNRAYDFINALCQKGIISKKHFNHPRTVIPQSFEEVPEDIIKLLLGNGYSRDDIVNAIDSREID